jgi:hypothetical protein
MEPGWQASEANFNITKDIFLGILRTVASRDKYSVILPQKAVFFRFEAFKRKEKREFVTKYSISSKSCCPWTNFHPKK